MLFYVGSRTALRAARSCRSFLTKFDYGPASLFISEKTEEAQRIHKILVNLRHATWWR